jgi:hypothetical protein
MSRLTAAGAGGCVIHNAVRQWSSLERPRTAAGRGAGLVSDRGNRSRLPLPYRADANPQQSTAKLWIRFWLLTPRTGATGTAVAGMISYRHATRSAVATLPYITLHPVVIRFWLPTGSGKDSLDHFTSHNGWPFRAAVMHVSNAQVVEAQCPQHGRMNVVDVRPPLRRIHAELVG